MAIYEQGVLTAQTSAAADYPYAQLWVPSGARVRLLEIGMCNTAATTSKVGVKRTTARGTVNASLTGSPLDTNEAATVAQVDNFIATTAPTVTGGYMRRGHIANVIGASLLWSWWNSPLIVASGLGVAVVQPTAVLGGILEMWFVWEA
jgi:hypothetical protein